MKRALVVHTGGIGDFLLTCPALELLADSYSLTLAGIPDRLQLAVDAGIAERAVSLDSIRFDSIFGEPAEPLRGFVRNFDRIVLWMRDDDGAIRNRMTKLTHANIDIHPGLPPDNWSSHASAYYLDCLGLESEQFFRLNIQPADESHDIIIHPGSGGPNKNWPLENYLALEGKLRENERSVLWSLGPAELEQGYDEHLNPTLTCETLTELARHLAAARHYIGNDSGITHLAAVVGTPTIALFGPTNPEVWEPRARNVTVLPNAFGNPALATMMMLSIVNHPAP